jgi:hypothetical protein
MGTALRMTCHGLTLHCPVLPRYLTKSVSVYHFVEFMWMWCLSLINSLHTFFASTRVDGWLRTNKQTNTIWPHGHVQVPVCAPNTKSFCLLLQAVLLRVELVVNGLLFHDVLDCQSMHHCQSIHQLLDAD